MVNTNTRNTQKPRLSLKSLLKISWKMLAERRVLSKQKQLGLPEKISFELVPRLLDNNKVTFTSCKLQIIVSQQNQLIQISVVGSGLGLCRTRLWYKVMCFYLSLERRYAVLWCPKLLIIKSLTTNLAAAQSSHWPGGSTSPSGRHHETRERATWRQRKTRAEFRVKVSSLSVSLSES